MKRDTFFTVTQGPAVDYAHLPGEEQNPLMESTAHVDWSVILLNSVRHTLANTDNLVTGNVPFAPDDGGPHQAPDLMVIPGAAGRSFGRYEPGPGDPLPSVCVEIVSPSNTAADLARRSRRLLQLGVAEVYILHPLRNTVVRVELRGDELVHTSAIGILSPAMAVTFALVEGRLAVCCPGGRMVRPGDDPFGWLVDEMNRADQADRRAESEAERANTEAERADRLAAQADESMARIAALEAELARVRAQGS
jgi:Uma2 family endonuclease